MANENFIVKVAPTLAIKNFFRGIDLDVTGITHPYVAKYSYMITVSERQSLINKALGKPRFEAKVDLQQRALSVKSNESVFLVHAKNIVTAIGPLMRELELEDGMWTITVNE